MRDLADYIIKQLVTLPDQVEVTDEESQEGVTIFVKVAPEDMGLVIGKAGATIKAIRKILTIRAMADQVRVNIRIVDDNPPAAAE